jgi:hypothetical protein
LDEIKRNLGMDDNEKEEEDGEKSPKWANLLLKLVVIN